MLDYNIGNLNLDAISNRQECSFLFHELLDQCQHSHSPVKYPWHPDYNFRFMLPFYGFCCSRFGMSKVEQYSHCELMEPSQYNSPNFETSTMLTHSKWNSLAAKILELPQCLHVYQKWQGAE
jgi:hypothetical protein